MFREVYGRAVATLIGVFCDITLAEDAVQDAIVLASDLWRIGEIPPNPDRYRARNRAIDELEI